MFVCFFTYSALVFVCYSEAAAHAVATLAEATLQGGGQIVLAETAAAVGALAGVQDATGTQLSATQQTLKQHKIKYTSNCSNYIIIKKGVKCFFGMQH